MEEQFYLTLPLLVRFMPRKALFPVVSGLSVLIATSRAWACWHGVATQNQAYVLPWLRADALLIGVLCALLMRNAGVMTRLERYRWALVPVASALAAAIVKPDTALPPAEESPRMPLMMFGLTPGR